MTMYVNADDRKKILPLKDYAVNEFTDENWLELGILTNCSDIIQNHPRLLRSLHWGDPDYSGCVLDVLISIVERDIGNLEFIENYITTGSGESGTNVSSIKTNTPKIVFNPSVFEVPSDDPNPNLVSVMMPFSPAFSGVYQAIKSSVEANFLICKRAGDIWQHSVLIQDVFSLIYQSHIVVCDFTGKNPNVFYEAGIAHTLGKHVIPITQSKDDIPFDLQHHRYVMYLNNNEGLNTLRNELVKRIDYLNKNRS